MIPFGNIKLLKLAGRSAVTALGSLCKYDEDGYQNVVKNTISRHCNNIAIIPSHSAWKVFINIVNGVDVCGEN